MEKRKRRVRVRVKKRKNKSKKILQITAIILAVICIGIGGLVWWQWDNVQAIYLYSTNSNEAIEENLTAQREKTEQTMTTYGITVKDITPEQEAGIVDGTLTAAEVIEQMYGVNTTTDTNDTSSEDDSSQTTQSTSTTESTELSESAKQAIILSNEAATQLYTYKIEFLGDLGDLYSKAVDEYVAAIDEGKSGVSKTSVAMGYAVQAAQLEAECDALVLALLNNLETELKALGESTDIISAMKTSYKEEKATKKAYYMSKLA